VGALKPGRRAFAMTTLHTSGMLLGSLSIGNVWGATSYIFFTLSFWWGDFLLENPGPGSNPNVYQDCILTEKPALCLDCLDCPCVVPSFDNFKKTVGYVHSAIPLDFWPVPLPLLVKEIHFEYYVDIRHCLKVFCSPKTHLPSSKIRLVVEPNSDM
jgi:hypothetical protein